MTEQEEAERAALLEARTKECAQMICERDMLRAALETLLFAVSEGSVLAKKGKAGRDAAEACEGAAGLLLALDNIHARETAAD